jgi:hypothetical protein
VNSLVAPGSDIAHRGLDMKWVNKLAHSFKTTCQINEDIHVLLRTDVERPDGKVSLDDLEATGASMEVIAGHHSIEAMKILHSTYPKIQCGPSQRVKCIGVKIHQKHVMVQGHWVDWIIW